MLSHGMTSQAVLSQSPFGPQCLIKLRNARFESSDVLCNFKCVRGRERSEIMQELIAVEVDMLALHQTIFGLCVPVNFLPMLLGMSRGITL